MVTIFSRTLRPSISIKVVGILFAIMEAGRNAGVVDVVFIIIIIEGQREDVVVF
jgi:hypothetical protein